MATPDPPLEAEAITVVRDGTDILDEISLTVPAGARTLIQGPSGSGKTTLFQVLGLLAPPDDGRLYVDGTDVSQYSDRKRAALRRTHVGLVFQDFQLIPDLTAWENAKLPQEHTGHEDTDWLGELFEELGIASLQSQYPGTLSGGERQRVAIARALANRPTVVLADEPTGQLDPETANRVLDLFLRVQDDAESALAMISHNDAVRDRFETTYRLVDGQLSDAAQQDISNAL